MLPGLAGIQPCLLQVGAAQVCICWAPSLHEALGDAAWQCHVRSGGDDHLLMSETRPLSKFSGRLCMLAWC